MNLISLCLIVVFGSSSISASAATLFGIRSGDSVASIKLRRLDAEFLGITENMPKNYFALKINDKDIPGNLYANFHEVKSGWFAWDEYRSIVSWVRFMPIPPLSLMDAVRQYGVADTNCITEGFFRTCSDTTGQWLIHTNLNDKTVRSIDLYFIHPYSQLK